MKHFTKLLMLVAIAVMTAATATAGDFVIKVPAHADKLVCMVSSYSTGDQTITLHDGDNNVTAPEYAQLKITAVSPYVIEGVTLDGVNQSLYEGAYTSYVNDYINGKTIVVTVANASELRDGTFTITASGLDKVSDVQLSGYGAHLDLVEGTQTIAFDTDVETAMYVSSKDYQMPLYLVSVDGTPIAEDYGTYTVPLTDGCNVVIQGNWPDKDVTVTITYGDGAEGCIQEAKVDGETVADFNGSSVAMKAGQRLELVQSSAYKIDQLTVDGVQASWGWSTSYSTLVKDNMVINIDAHQYAKIAVTIDIDHPEYLTVYRGYAYNNDVITLNEGLNSVDVYENATTISWKTNAGCIVKSVTLNDTDDYTGRTYCDVAEGDKITFETEALEMDKVAVVWVDNKDIEYFRLANSFDYADVGGGFQNGYNMLPFCDQYNPFMLQLSATENMVNQIYLNGELLIPYGMTEHPGSASYCSYEVPFTDNGVLKIFLAEEPVECGITFDVADDVTVDPVVVTDIVKTAADWRSGMVEYAGTQFNITGDNACPVDVEVNGVKIVPADDTNNHEFTIGQATSVKITKNTESGIFGFDAEAVTAPVFNMQGIRVADSLNALPAGVYIQAGKKVIVK